MEQTKALNALAPFLALIKTTTSPKAAIDVIQRATTAPDTYVFSELLITPQVRGLQADESTLPYYTQLAQFCYGTSASYAELAAKSKLPELNEAQTKKLRLLSLLTYAKDPHNLTYNNLGALLKVENVPELEDLVTTAVYKGLLAARLDPRQQRVTVTSIAPLRDVDPTSIPELLSTLSAWSSRCTSTLSDIESQISAIKTASLQRYVAKQEWDEQVQEMIDEHGKGKGKHPKGRPEVKQPRFLSKRVGGGQKGVPVYFQGDGRRLGTGGDDDMEMAMDIDPGLDEDYEEGGIPIGPGGRGSRSHKKKFFGMKG